MPADQPARDRVRTALDATLFVEAGAGTGKTTELVHRIVALLKSGVPVASIAAITFTEAAAAELSERVRTEIEADVASGRGSAAEMEFLRKALEGLDGAAFETLHGFARRILAAFPLEAGLPPRFDLMDDVQATGAFKERWRSFLDTLLNDLESELPIERAFALGLSPDALQAVAREFHVNWDRLEAMSFAAGPEPRIDIERIVGPLAEACAAAAQNSNRDDQLVTVLLKANPLIEMVRRAPDEAALIRALHDSRWEIGGMRGRKGNWLKPSVEDVRAMVSEALGARTEFLECLAATAVPPLLDEVRRFVLRYADERHAQGTLEFHDLLVLARNLLSRDEAVRAQLAQRFSRLLIDEFQDTDPLQVEIARLLAQRRTAASEAAAAAEPIPAALMPKPRPMQLSLFAEGASRPATPQPPRTQDKGVLFFVGDAKQSIYRFRRADIEVYETTRAEFGAEAVHLTENFRSVAKIVDWVNGVFPPLMSETGGGQARFISLTVGRQGDGATGGVYTFGGTRKLTAAAVRSLEATEIAAALKSIRDGNWPIGAEGRRATLADVAVLLPTRTGLRSLERKLEDEGIPFRLESKSRAYRTQELRDLRAILGAIADPTDAVAVVGALRSPGFGCTDRELLEFAEAGGSWNTLRSLPAALAAAHRVCAGITWLREVHDQQWWMTVNELVERVVRERRLLELGFGHRRPREVWQRIRIVQEQARAFVERGGNSLQPFVDWLEDQEDEGTQTKESVQPEADDDAVRILTIHAAKGLEFPITIIGGLGAGSGPNRTARVIWPSAGAPAVEVALGAKTHHATPGFEAAKTRDEQLDSYEAIRKLYVATTRAKDYLIVSLFRADRATKSLAEQLDGACNLVPGLWEQREFSTEEAPAPSPRAAPPTEPVEDGQVWAERRQAALAASARSNVLTATAIRTLGAAAGVGEADEKAEQVEVDEPWRRGRAGTSVGRAVHAVLQSIDLGTGDGLTEAAAAQAAAEGVSTRASDVARLARAALESEPVREAVRSDRYWREVFVGTVVGDSLLEGFIDLLYEGPDGLVVVDYKTDGVPDAAAIDAAMERYRLQGAAYALAVETLLGKPVARCAFVFAGATGGAAVRDVGDLGAAMDEVRGIVAGGS